MKRLYFIVLCVVFSSATAPAVGWESLAQSVLGRSGLDRIATLEASLEAAKLPRPLGPSQWHFFQALVDLTASEVEGALKLRRQTTNSLELISSAGRVHRHLSSASGMCLIQFALTMSRAEYAVVGNYMRAQELAENARVCLSEKIKDAPERGRALYLLAVSSFYAETKSVRGQGGDRAASVLGKKVVERTRFQLEEARTLLETVFDPNYFVLHGLNAIRAQKALFALRRTVTALKKISELTQNQPETVLLTQYLEKLSDLKVLDTEVLQRAQSLEVDASGAAAFGGLLITQERWAIAGFIWQRYLPLALKGIEPGEVLHSIIQSEVAVYLGWAALGRKDPEEALRRYQVGLEHLKRFQPHKAISARRDILWGSYVATKTLGDQAGSKVYLWQLIQVCKSQPDSEVNSKFFGMAYFGLVQTSIEDEKYPEAREAMVSFFEHAEPGRLGDEYFRHMGIVSKFLNLVDDRGGLRRRCAKLLLKVWQAGRSALVATFKPQ